MDDSDGYYEDYHDEQAPQIKKILDLTKGTGGELRPQQQQQQQQQQPSPQIYQQQQQPQHQTQPQHPLVAPQQAQEYLAPQPVAAAVPQPQQLASAVAVAASTEDVDMEEDDDEEDEEIAMARAEGPAVAARNVGGGGAVVPHGSIASKKGGHINPNTPGKVVEAGQEQTGRWTKQEHEAFLSALRMYGKEWKKVAAKVKTRTVVQTRTHAQKYFQKLQKAQESAAGVGAGDVDYVDMGISGDGGGSAQKPGAARAGMLNSHKKKRLSQPPPSQQQHQQQQQHAAVPNSSVSPPPPGISIAKTNRRSSNATLSAAQVISNLSHATTATTTAPPPAPSILSQQRSSLSPTSSFASAAAAARQRPQHGFSTDDGASAYAASSAPSGWASAAVSAAPSSMKIVAPDPMATMSKGKFPEPSPAATGKRKLAEIAAARMLAGVAGGVTIPPPASSRNADIALAMMDREDATATPPPEPYDSHSGGLNIKEAPLPPLFSSASNSTAAAKPPGPLSLQIVNPDSLGVTYEKKRKLNDGGSPVTPFESELEALVNEKAKAEEDAGDTDSLPGAPPLTKPASTEQKLHSVCGPGDAFGRSPLHRAVCELDIAALRVQLGEVANQSAGVLARLDKGGYAPMHTAASLRMVRPENAVAAQEMVRTLLAAGADPNTLDGEGNTPLHWAARAGDKNVGEVLLLRNCPLDSQNKRGETALHWGMRAGHAGRSVVTLLVENGARITTVNKRFKRPIDLAAEGFLDNEGSLASLKERDASDGYAKSNKMSRDLKRAYREKLDEIRETRVNFFARSTGSRSLLLHHRECLEHVAKSNSDWEAPDRVASIMTRIAQSTEVLDHEIVISSEFERANLDLLSRVHSTDYLQFVQSLSKDLEKKMKASASAYANPGSASEEGDSSAPPVVPFTPMVQRSMIKVRESAVKSIANSDTAFSAGSLRAARRAAGAVQHAVDCVLVGRNRNAFCAVRPPGHHAGVRGLLDGGESCGFCIFNNVAAGALHAISDERLLCERCAIVDIDVHHGNGTEEIVREYNDPSKLFFFSIHLYENDNKRKRGSSQFQYKFYPGTGAGDDLAMNIINVPILPLWKDPVVPSAPVTRTHNTRQKARGSDQEESPAGTPRGGSGSESGSVNMPSPKPEPPSGMSTGRAAYRDGIQNRLLPALRAFNPDLILVSAGFDAVKGDVGNAKHERGGRVRAGMDLEPEDYAWATRKILEIADMCCNGRVVSVLEGGYGSSQQATEDNAPPRPLDRSLFAECAVRHLHAMVDPYDVERRFTSIS